MIKTLIVDDDKDILEHLTLIGDQLGLSYKALDNFEDAMAYLEENEDLDTVIVDFNLGRKRGNELVSYFQSRDLSKSAVIISGHDLMEVIEGGPPIDSSRLGFFEKPLNTDEIVNWFKEHFPELNS